MRGAAMAGLMVVTILIGAGMGYLLGSANMRTITSISTTTSTTTIFVATTVQGVYGSRVECDNATSCSAQNPHGFVVTLSINTTRVVSNGTFSLNVSEFNPTPRSINLSSSDGWALSGLTSFYYCYQGSPPYGAAIYRGYYTLLNISSAHSVSVYDVIFLCGGLPRSASWFAAPPSSGLSVTYRPFATETVEPFAAVVHAMNGDTVNTCFPNGQCLPVVVYSLRSSQPGVYTLVAGDEWGALVLLHFTVVPSG